MTNSDLQILNSYIDKLQVLRGKIQTLRTIPINLLQSNNTSTEHVTTGLKSVKGIGEEGLGDDVQSALTRANESLESDASDLAWTRREKRKPRRQMSVTSPEMISGRDRTNVAPSIFPSLAEEGLKMEDVPDWAREFNRTHSCKLRLRDKVLRLTIPDIMTAYLSFGVVEDGQILVETIRIFGPREVRGGPHGQSQYAVFQLLSQELGKVLEQEGRVKLQSLMELLAGYSSLFISACRVCGRVVSSEGHVPPVVRRWENDGWISEHVSCTDGPTIG